MSGARSIVITGGTRGLGLGLARSLVALGHRVTVCGTDPDRVAAAEAELGVPALVADVTDRARVQDLWDEAVRRHGRVDIWVNNAGISHHRLPLWRLPAGEARAVVEVNLLGTVNGCAVAAAGMAGQGGGHIWNMEGLGSDGRTVPGLGVYGATKRAVTYLTGALAKEAPDGVTAGLLSPGMVVTDLLTYGYSEAERERAGRIFAILADPVEVVAPWLAERLVSRARNGAHVRRLTAAKIAYRFAKAPFVRRP
ncbi:SDR family NAD(P)-dependent oxidoreductase [Nonomuraea spiralis]|uniref:SDR family NAD(P)-dependent oxidoreductase n=1 Tax=Nonomuraea spiralis TaxID=46182 RepID=A0ABV5IGG3_9ACTN|nr:SDR family oxidoreductase [Nonomuraea spiralis]GGS98872.1 short-chain dehydrogenase [Nonomuraea spiralis]